MSSEARMIDKQVESEKEDDDAHSVRHTGRWLIFGAIILTALWVIAAYWFPSCFHKNPGVPEWCIVDPPWGNASIGETGDYLTGWLTPLALFWFVITVFLQRYELLEQRREFIKGRRAAENQASHLDQSNKVRKEQSFIDILKESQEVRKWNIQAAAHIVQLLSGNAAVDFDLRKTLRFDPNKDTEQSSLHCLGYLEGLLQNPDKYRVNTISDELKTLYVHLRRSLEFYEDISKRSKDLDIKKLDHYLIGSMELRYRDACKIALKILDSANQDLLEWYESGPTNYGSPTWLERLASHSR